MLTVNCQSSIKIMKEKTLYFDPLKTEELHDADYIFITHTHWDHFSSEDILKIKKEDTIIIGPSDILEESLNLGFSKENIIIMKPNEELNIDSINIKTVPSYNKNKAFHPKENNWLGYVITIDNEAYYILGDTDALEENENIKCDILLIPIGGIYTMDYQEAATFTNKINPKKVIPIHYGMVVGSKEDFTSFKNLINKNIEVEEKINL